MHKLAVLVALLLIGLFSVTILAEQQEVYVLRLQFDGISLTPEQFYVTTVNYIEEFQQEGEFYVKIISFEDEMIYSRYFDISRTFTSGADPRWFDEEGNQIIIPESEEHQEELVYKELLLPYFSQGKRMSIGTGDTLLLELDLTAYARTCGDEQCQAHENQESCAEDCEEVSEEIKEVVEEVVEEESIIAEQPQAGHKYFPYFIPGGIFIILIGIMVYILRKIRKVKGA